MSPDDSKASYELALSYFQRAESVFDGLSPSADVRPDLLKAQEHAKRALAAQPDFKNAQRAMIVAHLGLGEIYEACIAGLKYSEMPPNDPNFPENLRDIRLRMGLDKTLRTPPGEGGLPSERPTPLPPARRRDDWEDAAIAEMTRLIPAPLTGTTAVFFHVDVGENHPFLGGRAGPKVDYLGTLEMACRCARVTQPGIKIILLSDTATHLQGFTGPDYVVRLPRDPNHLMYARLRACQALAMSGRLAGPALFLDTDVCLNRDFAPLLGGTFEVGVTYRSALRFPLMPINEGLFMSTGVRPAALAEFLGRCLDFYDWLAQLAFVRERYGFDVRFWRGGQLSMNLFAGWRVPPMAPEDATLYGVRCRFFHCETHNYSVPADSSLEGLDKYWALHFKGLLPKALMNQYFERIQQRAR